MSRVQITQCRNTFAVKGTFRFISLKSMKAPKQKLNFKFDSLGHARRVRTCASSTSLSSGTSAPTAVPYSTHSWEWKDQGGEVHKITWAVGVQLGTSVGTVVQVLGLDLPLCL